VNLPVASMLEDLDVYQKAVTFARAIVALALLGLLAAGCQRSESVRATANAQAQRAGALQSNQASRRNNGSAAVLRGRVAICHLWAEDARSSWSAAHQAAVRERVRVAIAFLTSRARTYGVDVTFVEDDAGRVRSASDIPTDMFADPIWTQRLVQSTGAADANAMVAGLKRRHRADGALLAIHVNKAASSYHLTFNDGVNPAYAAERVVYFSRYPDRTPTCAATYAHEMLHSFGAGELYFPFDRTDERVKRARRLFPNDIMLRVDRNIDAVSIGAWTAYRIGWTDHLDADLRAFED
jgi:hypothetical protein